MTEGRQLLTPLHLSVSASWEDTRARWRDAVAADFERRFWTEIDQATREFLAECERFEEILNRAENAVRDLD